MKTFRFTLQALLTLRQREERFAMEQYAQAVTARHQALDRLAAEDLQLAQVRRDVQGQLHAGVAAALLARGHAFCRSVELRRDAASAALARAEHSVQSALESMLEARRRREVVETCREKQQVRHARRRQYLEDRHHDELAARRAPHAFAWSNQN